MITTRTIQIKCILVDGLLTTPIIYQSYIYFIQHYNQNNQDKMLKSTCKIYNKYIVFKNICIFLIF